MNLSFLLFIAYGQKHMIDSRKKVLLSKTQELNQFSGSFSIWYTYQQTTYSDNDDLFIIVYSNIYLLRIQPQMMKTLIIFNQGQMTELEYEYLLEKTLWFHLIASQNQNFQNDYFFIDFDLPFTYQIQINTNKHFIFDSLILNQLINTQNRFKLINFDIYSIFQTKYFFLICSRLLCLISNNFVQSMIQLLIRYSQQQGQLTCNNLYFHQRFNYINIVITLILKYFKKVYNQLLNQNIVEYLILGQNLFELKERQDILEIFAFQQDRITGQYSTYRWFTTFVDFYDNKIEIEILCVDQRNLITVTHIDTIKQPLTLIHQITNT